MTGADGALGKYVTDRLVNDGWEIHAAVHNQKTQDELFVNFHGHINKRVFAYQCDITDASSVEAFFMHSGMADGLVHLAGGFVSNTELGTTSIFDFDKIIKLNTYATFLMLKFSMPILKMQRRGVIVTMGARPGIHPTAHNAVYASSKAAVIALTLAAAEEGRPVNVRANCIVPAVINTHANLQWGSEEESKKWTPPEDIADLITYLVSSKSTGVTGTVIPMYGKLHS